MSAKEKEGSFMHPDVEYLLTPDIANILSKGMWALYEKKPKNPVEYLALWLLNNGNEQTIKHKVRLLKTISSLKSKRKEQGSCKKGTRN